MMPRGRNRGGGFRYTPNARNTPDAAVPQQGVMGGMLHVPAMELNAVATAETAVPQPVPISALASVLASAPPDQQQAVGNPLPGPMGFSLSCLLT
jgi:polyadenylate-binding protein